MSLCISPSAFQLWTLKAHLIYFQHISYDDRADKFQYMRAKIGTEQHNSVQGS
jgi:hypothetical protein